MRFSIIIPVCNVAAELPRTMASLQAQTCRDYEIVLVDDGSTDGSAQLVDSYADVATVIHQPNSGVVAARQKGFAASKGEWIVFVDGDDKLVPDALSSISCAINRQDCEIVQYGYTMVSDGKDAASCGQDPEGCKSAEWIIKNSARTPLDYLGMCIWNKCYRRDVAAHAFEDVGDVRISHSEDGLYAFAALLHAKNICFLGVSLYCYVLRSSSAVHRVNLAIVNERTKFLERVRRLAEESGRMTMDQISRMIDFHAYQGCCYAFLMLKRNHASWPQVRQVLGELGKCEFFLRPNPEVNSMKRKLMYFLVRHPCLYFMAAHCGIIR